MKHLRMHPAYLLTVLCTLLSVGTNHLVFADATANAPATQPVTISALCSDSATSTAQFRIGNANPNPVNVSWQPAPANSPDTITAGYGYTAVTASYDASQSTPSVIFQQDGQPDQTVAVSTTPCTLPAAANCVDGYNRANLNVDWSPTGTVSFTTLNDAPLCADVTVYVSDYTLPATYDGSGVFDDSAIPQTKFDSASTVLKAGTAGGETVSISVPDACTDYQLDAYYAPEITSVLYSGQADQLIYGKIYVHTATDCNTTPVTPPVSNPPVTGGRGGGDVNGTMSGTPVAAPTVAAATTLSSNTPATTTAQQLADTGQSSILPSIAATVIGLIATAVYFPLLSKLRRAHFSR